MEFTFSVPLRNRMLKNGQFKKKRHTVFCVNLWLCPYNTRSLPVNHQSNFYVVGIGYILIVVFGFWVTITYVEHILIFSIELLCSRLTWIPLFNYSFSRFLGYVIEGSLIGRRENPYILHIVSGERPPTFCKRNYKCSQKFRTVQSGFEPTLTNNEKTPWYETDILTGCSLLDIKIGAYCVHFKLQMQ
jgi:hypothetical protein